MDTEVVYGLSKVVYSYKGKVRVSYGLVAFDISEANGALTVVASVNDLSGDEAKVQKLADMCNEGKLSLIHIKDVVEDFPTM